MTDETRSDICILYVTASGREEAVRIGRAVVERRLAACANVVGPTTAIYRWQDEICEDEEAVLILKTTARLADEAVAEIRNLHSYDLPCVLRFDIAGGLPPFLAWVADEVG
ncbi:MAG: divalent-cation tolerance protein CutA [Rhodospirillales bacterium]